MLESDVLIFLCRSYMLMIILFGLSWKQREKMMINEKQIAEVI